MSGGRGDGPDAAIMKSPQAEDTDYYSTDFSDSGTEDEGETVNVDVRPAAVPLSNSVNARQALAGNYSPREFVPMNANAYAAGRPTMSEVGNSGQVSSPRCSQLYVGDLMPEVTDQDLMALFGACGGVNTVHVMRDQVTHESRGYGYVNFINHIFAERALEALNFEELAGREIRVMWYQRDPALRRAGHGNTIIKNLDKRIGSKELFQTCMIFGKILSAKVATDETGESKGYGFIHYENVESAKLMIEKMNGLIIDDNPVTAEHYFDMNGYTIYVKSIPQALTDTDILQLFSSCGEIEFHKFIPRTFKKNDMEGINMHCVIAYVTEESANKALEITWSDPETGKDMVIQRFIPKSQARRQEANNNNERADLYIPVAASGIGALSIEEPALAPTPGQKLNLYVKNIPSFYSVEKFRGMFEPLGTITSHGLASSDGRNTCHGFVSFSTQEEAEGAIKVLNGRLCEAGPLFVGLHQSRQERQRLLEQKKNQWSRSQNAGAGDGISTGSNSGLDRPGTTAGGNFALNRPGTTSGGNFALDRPGTTAGGNFALNRPGTGTSSGGNFALDRPGTSSGGNFALNRPDTSSGGNFALDRPGASASFGYGCPGPIGRGNLRLIRPEGSSNLVFPRGVGSGNLPFSTDPGFSMTYRPGQVQQAGRGLGPNHGAFVPPGPSTFVPRGAYSPVADADTVREVGRRIQMSGAQAQAQVYGQGPRQPGPGPKCGTQVRPIPPFGLDPGTRSAAGPRNGPLGNGYATPAQPRVGLPTPRPSRPSMSPMSPNQTLDAEFVSSLVNAQPHAQRTLLGNRLTPKVEARLKVLGRGERFYIPVGEIILDSGTSEGVRMLEDEEVFLARVDDALGIIDMRAAAEKN